jgi:hypothetical protein
MAPISNEESAKHSPKRPKTETPVDPDSKTIEESVALFEAGREQLASAVPSTEPGVQSIAAIDIVQQLATFVQTQTAVVKQPTQVVSSSLPSLPTSTKLDDDMFSIFIDSKRCAEEEPTETLGETPELATSQGPTPDSIAEPEAEASTSNAKPSTTETHPNGLRASATGADRPIGYMWGDFANPSDAFLLEEWKWEGEMKPGDWALTYPDSAVLSS